MNSRTIAYSLESRSESKSRSRVLVKTSVVSGVLHRQD